MITRDQALDLGYREHVHYTGPSGKNTHNSCVTTLGPKGGVSVITVDCRVNGNVQTWKTRPTEFRVPIKYGMREHGEINPRNAVHWHLASECAAKYMTTLCYACGWTSGSDWTHDHLKVNGKACRNAPRHVSTEVCVACGHWQTEHIHVSDNPDEPDGSYCEACRIVGNPNHEYTEEPRP